MHSGQGAAISVLYVGAEPEAVETAATTLEDADDGLSVRTATSAREGRRALADGTVDCVVSGYALPDTTGVDFLRWVREEHGDLPFVLHPASGSEAVASEAIAADVTEYVKATDDGDATALAERIVAAVSRHRSRRREEKERRIGGVVRAVNEALVGASTRAEIDERVCSIVAEAEPYRFAWVGEHDQETQTVEPRAAAGVDADYLHSVEIRTDDTDAGHGPTGEAVRRGELAVSQDIPDDPQYEPWREEAIERGYESSAAIPLEFEGTLYGVLNVYADRTNAFDAVERQLLSDLGETIAHAHHRIALQERTTRQLEELERTSALLSTLFDAFPAGVLAEDESRNVLAANRRLFDLFDLEGDPEDLVGADCDRLARDLEGRFGGAERFASRIEEIVADQDPVDDEPLELRDGRTFERSYRPIDLPDADGHLWVYRDVTERRRRRQELETILERMNDAVLVHGAQSAFMFVNRTAIEQYGYDEAALLEMRPRDLDVPDEAERISERIERIERDGELVFETEHRRASGETFPVEVSAVAVRFRGKPAILSIVRDITERKKRERELKRQVERLDEFASVVSHDLRNPLNVAQGRIDLVREDCESEHLVAAANGIDRALTLIEDMLALARAGKQTREMVDVTLADLARTSWEHVETADAELRIELDETVRGDRNRLRQLVENLFRNAIDHGGEDVTVTVGSLPGGFFVEDDGPGVPVEHRDDVFEPGYSSTDDGTGFGLAIVKQIVDAHDWEIQVTEGSSGGARFEITGVFTPQ